MSNTNNLTGLAKVNWEKAKAAAENKIDEIMEIRKKAAAKADAFRRDAIDITRAKWRGGFWTRTRLKAATWTDGQVWAHLAGDHSFSNNTYWTHRSHEQTACHYAGHALTLCQDVIRAADASNDDDLYLSLETIRTIGLQP